MTKKRLAVAAVAASLLATTFGGVLVACDTPDEGPSAQSVYTVTFDAQGGTVTPASATTTDGKLSELPTPINGENEFGGWFLTATCTGDELTVSYTYTEDTTIYAKWTEPEPEVVYTVSFNAGEGTYLGAATVDTVNGMIPILTNPTAPTKMKFIGWYTAETDGERVTTLTKLTGDQTQITLYARYQQEYEMSFDAGDGTLEATTLLTDDGKIATPPTPTAPDGYTFDGWYTAEEGGEKVTSNTVFSADGTLYARYVQKEYTVSFDANGGTLAEGTVAVDTVEGKLTAFPTDPTPPTNAVFLGWYTTAVEGGELVTTDTVLSADGTEITLYARYRQEYVITFDAGEGELEEGAEATAVTMNGMLSELPDASHSEKAFVGWYTAATGGSRVSTAYAFVGDTTVYARYRVIEVEYTVSFDAGDGTLAEGTDDMTTVGGKLTALPSDPTPPTNFKFIGWYTEATGGDKVTTSYVIDAEGTAVTLYAHYQQEYVVTFNAGNGSLEATSAVTDDGKIAELPTPTAPTGYTFDGWYTEATGGGKVTATTKFTADGEIFAQYKLVEYIITFNANGGTLADGTEPMMTTASKLSELPTVTPPTNAVFLGWFTAVENGDEVTPDYSFVGDVHELTVYAVYRQEYAVTFSVGAGTLEEGVANKAVTVSGKLESLPTVTPPTKHKFLGWFTASTGGEEVTTEKVYTKNTTIYAHYEEIPPVVTVTLNGEALELKRVEVAADDTAKWQFTAVNGPSLDLKANDEFVILIDGQSPVPNFGSRPGGHGSLTEGNKVTILADGTFTFYLRFYSDNSWWQVEVDNGELENVIIGDLYIVGSFTDWSCKEVYHFGKDGGTFTKYLEAGAEFKITSCKDASGTPTWDPQYGSESVNVGKGYLTPAENIVVTEAGTYTITLANGKISITCAEFEEPTTIKSSAVITFKGGEKVTLVFNLPSWSGVSGPLLFYIFDTSGTPANDTTWDNKAVVDTNGSIEIDATNLEFSKAQIIVMFKQSGDDKQSQDTPLVSNGVENGGVYTMSISGRNWDNGKFYIDFA